MLESPRALESFDKAGGVHGLGTGSADVPFGMTTDRLEAIGPRGEACIIVRTAADGDGAAKRYRYTLAAGDRLRPTETSGVFETFDGKRQYRLRDAASHEATLPESD